MQEFGKAGGDAAPGEAGAGNGAVSQYVRILRMMGGPVLG